MKKKLVLSLIAPIIILLYQPFGLSINQSIVYASLLLTITWWVTAAVQKTYASIFLLLTFCIFGSTPLEKIFMFPLSENFIMIILSFLFSQGIINSGIVEKLIEPILFYYIRSIYSLISSVFVFAFILMLIIPQPYARVIILSSIYCEYFNRLGIDKGLKELLLFSIFSFTVAINMMFVRGDIILNNALLAIGELSIDEIVWAKYMAVPTFVFCFLCAVLFIIIFKKSLKTEAFKKEYYFPQKNPLTDSEKRYLLLIAATVVLWSLEPVHGLKNIVAVSIIIMFCFGLLKKADLKCINTNLLVYLTAAFSIGGVMTHSGIAQIIFSSLTRFFPETFSIWYMLVVICTCIGLHAVLGSSITTLSVVIPGLSLISSGIVQKEILLFTIFVSVCGHYFMPFHSVIIMIGEGKKYYSNSIVLKYGIALTLLIIISVLCIFLPWWMLVGIAY